MKTITWSLDKHSGGYTGIILDQWKIYVLLNGTWTIYQWGKLSPFAAGKSASVPSAKISCKKIVSGEK